MTMKDRIEIEISELALKRLEELKTLEQTLKLLNYLSSDKNLFYHYIQEEPSISVLDKYSGSKPFIMEKDNLSLVFYQLSDRKFVLITAVKTGEALDLSTISKTTYKKLQEQLISARLQPAMPKGDSEMELAAEIVNAIEGNADKVFKNKGFKEINISNIEIDDLLELQKSFFPDGYPNIGLRKREVWLSLFAGTVVTESDDNFFKPVSADKVFNELQKLLKEWNVGYQQLLKRNTQEKINAMASFHKRFLEIHPFLDANGRVSKTLLALQAKALLDVSINLIMFNDMNEDYYNSLADANDGNMCHLQDFIAQLIGNSPLLTSSRK